MERLVSIGEAASALGVSIMFGVWQEDRRVAAVSARVDVPVVRRGSRPRPERGGQSEKHGGEFHRLRQPCAAGYGCDACGEEGSGRARKSAVKPASVKQEASGRFGQK